MATVSTNLVLLENGLCREKKKIEKEGWVVFNRRVFFENDRIKIIYILSFPATTPFSIPGFGNNF